MYSYIYCKLLKYSFIYFTFFVNNLRLQRCQTSALSCFKEDFTEILYIFSGHIIVGQEFARHFRKHLIICFDSLSTGESVQQGLSIRSVVCLLRLVSRFSRYIDETWHTFFKTIGGLLLFLKILQQVLQHSEFSINII